MQFFEETIREKIFSFWQNFRAELILIFISLIIVFISLAVFIKASNEAGKEEISFETLKTQPPKRTKIYVDLSGAVEKPDVYEVTMGARLKEVLVLANGLSADADRQFFARNFNLARILTDQEKIYIPSKEEVRQGLFKEGSYVVDQISPRTNGNTTEASGQENLSGKINLNTASLGELDTLPGIGPVTAQKIISQRPYSSVEELLTKKVVSKGVYEKIKELVMTE